MNDDLTLGLMSLHKQFNALSPISIDDLLIIKNIVKLEKYPRGTFFLKPGDSPDKVGFTLSGLTKTYFLSESGEEMISGFGVEGNITGLYGNLLKKEKSTYFIQMLEDTTLLVTHHSRLVDSTKHSHSWTRLHLAISQHLYIYLSDVRQNIDLKDATERYNYFIKNFPNLIDRVPQNQFAKYLRINEATLSRIKNQSGKYKRNENITPSTSP